MKLIERLAARFPSLANSNLDATDYEIRVKSARTNATIFVARKILQQIFLMPFYLLLAAPLALAGAGAWLWALDRNERAVLRAYCRRFWYYPSLCIHKTLEGRRFRSVALRSPCLEIGCEDGSMTVLHFPGMTFDVGVEYIEANRPVSGVHRDVVIAGLPHLPAPWTGHFRGVALVHVIDHIPDLALALAELRRITAPGGQVCLSGFTHGYPTHVRAASLGALTPAWLERHKGFHHFLPEAEWRHQFAAAGFRVTRYEPFLGGLRGRLWVVLHTLFEINGSNDLFYAADRLGLVPRLLRNGLFAPFTTVLTAFFLHAPIEPLPCHFYAELEAIAA